MPPPRLLVCEAGAAIVLVPRDAAPAARRALAATAARPGLEIVPVVTSGTITTVKARLGVSARKGPRGA